MLGFVSADFTVFCAWFCFLALFVFCVCARVSTFLFWLFLLEPALFLVEGFSRLVRNMAARREKNVQVYAEDVTDVMMEEITKIAQEAFHLNFDEFLASKVFTRIADHIRTNLDKRYGRSYEARMLFGILKNFVFILPAPVGVGGSC